MPPVHAEVTPLCSATRPQDAESKMKKKNSFGKRTFHVSLDDRTKRYISLLPTVRSICAIHRTSDQTTLTHEIGRSVNMTCLPSR